MTIYLSDGSFQPLWILFCLDQERLEGDMAAQEPSPPSSMENNKPGFPKKILANKLEDKHLCNCCQNILRRPFQAQCGHRFCSYCFNRTVG